MNCVTQFCPLSNFQSAIFPLGGSSGEAPRGRLLFGLGSRYRRIRSCQQDTAYPSASRRFALTARAKYG
jgi:hypothetical protein